MLFKRLLTGGVFVFTFFFLFMTLRGAAAPGGTSEAIWVLILAAAATGAADLAWSILTRKKDDA